MFDDEPDGFEEISNETAKELIGEADRGILVLLKGEPVPTLGDVPPEEQRVEITSEGYAFGDPKEEETDA